MINDYCLYVVLALSITTIPGPAVILTIKNSIQLGYPAALVNIVGNFIAMLMLASVSAAGLGALIVTTPALFSVMKILGCLYLIYLGVKLWRAPYAKEPILFQGEAVTTQRLLSVFHEGFAVGISNPKAIAFFSALFPQFIDPARSFTPQFLSLILTIEGISFLVLSTYAVVSSYASSYLTAKKPILFFNKLAGSAFVGFGLVLIYPG